VTSIVLVHGGFVDGSGWEAVYRILRQDGHAVTVVQNPTLSLADDAAVTRRARWTGKPTQRCWSGTRTAAPSSPRPAPIPRLRRWYTSPRSPPTAANR
jgi:hypothetical protein